VEKKTTLILASASTSRAHMLRAVGLHFTVHPSRLDESALQKNARDGIVLAQNLAGAKALAVSRLFPKALVLGADSVLIFGDAIINKSRNMDEAKALLLRLGGQHHRLVSAAALAQNGALVWCGQGEGLLTMRALSAGFVDAYLAAEGPGLLSCVGCYRLEGRGAQLFDSVQGDYFSILGLPLLALLAALRDRNMACI
jgi:septum formation protein